MCRETGIRATIVIGMLGILGALAACDPGSRDEASKDGDARQNADRMLREHDGDSGTPSAGAGIPPDREVVAETLAYAEVNEELVYGHFVFPADMVNPLPGLIVVHEWWGLNDGVRAMADRLAAEGYIVLAVDLFGGKTADHPPAARELMLAALQKPELAEANLRQAYEFIRDTGGAPKIGSLGWCFGGAWALNAALMFPDELDATVIYYGQVPAEAERLAPLNVPILGLFAENDRGIPVETVRSFEQALENLEKDFEIEVFPDVGHAFANPSGTSYDADAAGRAWELTTRFLKEHLGTTGDPAET
ncbi:MAG TPA: dienelactone hydrolase family protein [Woeseiaceae bacterium]|jgi:carboxymethylenebutenolidase|nr:dienelactone hydrolase family protein [Woeseiaceae bacterium]